MAKKNDKAVPQNAFDGDFIFPVGGDSVISTFFGEGHTKDNIVSYIPSEKVLFGGCLIKEINGTRGYVAEGNVREWSSTVRKVKARFGETKMVIPGHGVSGGQDLLDYTMTLFSVEERKE